ncbi:MAG: hypothetical protein HW388_329 [Dehalococcoidia bacterium]|nr:hypothetical protein [Dehalococcoidia bacterium]
MKESSKQGPLDFDLLFELSYLSAVASAGIPRSQMFHLAAELPCAAASYFHEVDSMAQNMNYQIAEACRLVGENAKEQEVQSLLLRLSSSLSSGEAEADFMAQEASTQAESYGNAYEGQLEGLRRWTDAFTALMVSTVLIIVVATISTVIYDMGTKFVTGLVGVMILISCLGTWVIYRAAPKEIKTLLGPQGHASQRLPRLLLWTCGPGALVTAAALFAAGMSLGWMLVGVSVLLFPIGVASIRFDARISRLDGDISTLLRVVGSTASAIGSTPTEALARVDLRSMASLAPAVKRLRARLQSQSLPALCWGHLVTETGSELVSRGTRIFLDGISMDGDAGEVGKRAALLTSKVNYLRVKRKLIASSFTWLCLLMHTTIIFLLLFVIEIVSSFGMMLNSVDVANLATGQGAGAAMGGLIGFSFQNIEFLQVLMVPEVIVLSVINAAAPTVAEGGYQHKFFFFLSITLAMTGANLLIVPKLVGMIFNIVPAS